MTPEIEPVAFAQLMSLPQGDRRDLLEFLGATAFARTLTERLIARVEGGRDTASLAAAGGSAVEH